MARRLNHSASTPRGATHPLTDDENFGGAATPLFWGIATLAGGPKTTRDFRVLESFPFNPIRHFGPRGCAGRPATHP